MITYTKKAGSIDVSVVVRIIDSTDGTPETGVVFNTAGIDLQYRREGAASVAITEATLAALTTAHTDGGFLHIGNGYYRLDLPDAAVAAGASGVLVHGTVTGMVVIGCYVELVAYDPADTVRLGLTALPNAAAEAAGGLYTRGTGAGQINQPANGMVDSNVVRNAGTAITAAAGRQEVNVSHWLGTAAATPTVAGVPEVDITHLNGTTAGVANLKTAFDDTAGPVPWLGVIDQGTAQSASSTGVVLRAAAAFADDTLIGAIIMVFGSTQGYWQTRVITDSALTGDSVTVDPAWTVTPSGTITYRILAGPASPTATPVPVNVTQISGDATAADNLEAALDGTGFNVGGGSIVAASVTGNVGGSVASVATNGISAASLAADAGTEIGTAVWATTTRTLSALDEDTTTIDLDATIRAAVGMAAADLDTQLATIDTVVDSILVDTAEIGVAGAGLTALATAANLATVAGYLDTEIAAILADTNELQTDWANGGRLDLILDARASQTSVDTMQTTIDKLDDTLVNSSDGWIFTIAALQDAPSGGGGLTAAAIADAVWEEAIADHSGTSGSTAEALNAAGAAGDPWITTLPGSYTSGQAGFILGTNLNATVSSRSSQTSVDDLPTNAELATALGTSDDAVLAVLGTPAGASLAADVAAVQADTNDIQGRLPAALVSGRIDASVGAMAANVMTAAAAAADLTTELQSGLATASALSAVEAKIDTVDTVVDAILVDTAEIGVAGAGLTALASASNLAIVASYLDTEIAAIKAKTDNLPAAPAAVSDIPTAAAIADAVHDEAVDGAVTFRQSVRLANSVLGGKASGLETTAAVYRDLGDTKDRITATVDVDGNRTAVTRDLT